MVKCVGARGPRNPYIGFQSSEDFCVQNEQGELKFFEPVWRTSLVNEFGEQVRLLSSSGV